MCIVLIFSYCALLCLAMVHIFCNSQDWRMLLVLMICGQWSLMDWCCVSQREWAPSGGCAWYKLSGVPQRINKPCLQLETSPLEVLSYSCLHSAISSFSGVKESPCCREQFVSWEAPWEGRRLVVCPFSCVGKQRLHFLPFRVWALGKLFFLQILKSFFGSNASQATLRNRCQWLRGDFLHYIVNPPLTNEFTLEAHL